MVLTLISTKDDLIEHFVTLFDHRFLLFGATLAASIKKQMPNSHLWVICIDTRVEMQIKKLNIKNITAIPLREVETDELLKVKSSRTLGEYCWTLTPFVAEAVFRAVPTVERVTYLDADLFFFRSPVPIFEEFESSKKHVLITEHAYGPGLDRTEASGRFCVQFLIFRRTPESYRVMKWWQERCLEWCFDRIEDGKFGDQKYLDQWPEIFGAEVHIFEQVENALAPWNVNFFLEKNALGFLPIFYHFQSFRIVSSKRARLYSGWKVGERGRLLYSKYLDELVEQMRYLNMCGIAIEIMPEPIRSFAAIRKMLLTLLGRIKYETFTSRLDLN